MHIEGKDLPPGKYLFHRYMTKNGEKIIVNTYKIKRTTEGYVFYNSTLQIEDEIRRIEFKKNNIAFIWTKVSRFGLLYTIQINL